MNEVLAQDGNDRDAHVVGEIVGYITATTPKSFFLFAGAGSGKTRTLVEVLKRLTGVVAHEAGSEYGRRLHAKGQSVQVITYTKNATSVVKGRLGDNELASVSTIHAFCWNLIDGYHDDIREALLSLNHMKLDEAKAEAAKKKRGETAKDHEKYAELETGATDIRATDRFRYHPDKNLYGRGALHHAEVVNVAVWLLNNRPTLQKIVEDRHPLILIDESQDTSKGLLDELFELSEKRRGKLTIGLLGDHRQRIYPDGHTDLPSHVPATWAKPALAMNHRSQKRIVDLINTVWEAEIVGRTQPANGVRQHSRTEKRDGVVRIFIGDTSVQASDKLRLEAHCADQMATVTGNVAWSSVPRQFHRLALEHKLAAKRGDFYATFAAMELLDKDAAAPKGNGENTGPTVVRMLLGPMLELAAAVDSQGSLNEATATNVLRRYERFNTVAEDAEERKAALEVIHCSVTEFALACSSPQATVRDVLAPVLAGTLFEINARLQTAFNDMSPPPDVPKVKSSEPKEDRQRRGWCALFECKWEEMARYKDYLAGKADLATHQVVKGSEFKHVMVVMDDDEAGGNFFSYSKILGGLPPSDADMKSASEGKETVIDKTLRLLYVTCSRAEESLALVLWTADPGIAIERVTNSGWFHADEIVAL